MNKSLKVLLGLISALFLAALPVALFIRKANEKVLNHHLKGWFSDNHSQLSKETQNYLSWAQSNLSSNIPLSPKAVVVPHAGHKFSGLAAASVYNEIKGKSYDKIVILTPSHSGKFFGLAAPDFDAYTVPSGKINIDTKTLKNLSKSDLLKFCSDEFEHEHSLEVQIPFLVESAPKTPILPFLVGQIKSPDQAKKIVSILNPLIGENDLLLVTSDFTHYGPNYGYSPFPDKHSFRVKVVDSQAIQAIMEGNSNDFGSFIRTKNRTVCGKNSLRLMLELFKENTNLKELSSRLTSYYSSLNSMNWYDFWPQEIAEITQVPISNSQNSFVTYAGLVFYPKPEPFGPIKNTFSDFEKALLKDMAKFAVHEAVFSKQAPDLRHMLIGSGVRKPMGVFITLKKNGELRGCIGRTITDSPLYKTISDMAYSSALQDSRFSPVTPDELNGLEVKLSILSRPQPVKSHKDIVLGKHGIVLEKTVGKTTSKALFLPEIAIEQGWNLETTLSHLSKKAGLAKDAWKEGCNFKVFETLSI